MDESDEEPLVWVESLKASDSQDESMLRSRVLSSVVILKEIHRETKSLGSTSENWAKFWTGWRYTLGLPASLLAAVAGVGALEEWTKWAAALAFASAALSAVIAFLRPELQEKRMRQKTTGFDNISNQVSNFLSIEMPNLIYEGEHLNESSLDLVHLKTKSFQEQTEKVEKNEDPEPIEEQYNKIVELKREAK